MATGLVCIKAIANMLAVRTLCIATLATFLDFPAFAVLSITELKARAKTNDEASCFELAWRYKTGMRLERKGETDLSVPKDVAEAQKWFLKAYDLSLPSARNGDNEAQHTLARICLLGLDDTNRVPEGVTWLRKAADGGHIQAQVDLGVGLLKGRWNLDRNDTEAVKYLSAAATRRHRVAVSELVDFYSAKEDYASAARWLHMLAQFGERDSQSKLGQWYAQGTGVKKDNIAAYKWLSLAAVPRLTAPAGVRDNWQAWIEREDKKYALSRDVHGALLTADEMKRAKQEIAEFKQTKNFHEEAKE